MMQFVPQETAEFRMATGLLLSPPEKLIPVDALPAIVTPEMSTVAPASRPAKVSDWRLQLRTTYAV